MNDSPSSLLNRLATGRLPGPGDRASTREACVTIVVPALNEADYIVRCLASLIRQWPAEACEILVMDGGSEDDTRQLVAAFAARHPQPAYPPIRLFDNPRRIQSAALNLAAVIAYPRSTILVRADAHAEYPPNFVQRCVADLLRTGATSVVVPMRNAAHPRNAVQRAIAVAQSSRLGNGGAAHRVGRESGFVDHGHHAAFDRAFFLSNGGYDERFTHNEDAEFDHRQALAGGRIWMCAEAAVTYYPRATLPALARQYYRHGHGRAQTLLKHRLVPRPRQLAPVIVLTGCAGAVAIAPVAPLVALGALVYPAGCLAWAGWQAVRRLDPWLVASAPALVTMHLSWASGFATAALSGLAGRLRRRRLPDALLQPGEGRHRF